MLEILAETIVIQYSLNKQASSKSRRFIDTTSIYLCSPDYDKHDIFPYLLREVFFLRDGISFTTHIVFINFCKPMLRL